MPEYVSYETLAEYSEQWVQALSQNPELQTIHATMEEFADEYASLAGDESYQRVSSAAKQVSDALMTEIRMHCDPVMATAEYVTGMPAEDLSDEAVAGAFRLFSEKAGGSLAHGDSSFSRYLRSHQAALNGTNQRESDMAILSQLAYANKWGDSEAYQRAAQREGITVREYCEGLLASDTLSDRPLERQFLQELAQSERFSGLTVDHALGASGGTGAGSETQVLVFGCGDGHAVVAIQGTNGTLEDWKTNTGFASDEVTREERYVTSLVDRYAEEYRSLDLTGHSQGGREAVTVGMFLSAENQRKIVRVYSNDGPGYSRDFLNRYAAQVGSIEGRVTNIRGSQSVVGKLEYAVGEVKYVRVLNVVSHYDASGNAVMENNHLSTTWMMDEQGAYSYTDGPGLISYSTFADLTGPLTNFLTTIMPEETVQTFLRDFIELGDNGDGTLNLGNLMDPEKLKTFYEEKGKPFIAEFQKGLEKLREDNLSDGEKELLAYFQFTDSFCGELQSYLKKLSKVSKELCKIDPKVGALVKTAIDILSVAVKIVQVLAKIGVVVLSIVAYFRERKKRKAREKYLAENRVVQVSMQGLFDAYNAMMNTVRALGEAFEALNAMLSCFKQVKKRLVKVEDSSADKSLASAADLTGKLKEEEYVDTVSVFAATEHVRRKTGLNPRNHSLERNRTKIGKAAGAVEQARLGAVKVLDGTGLGPDAVFMVNPTGLADYAASANVETDLLKEQLNRAEDCLQRIGSAWHGTDYDSQKIKGTEDLEKALENAKILIQMFESLGDIAGAYGQYQKASIMEFQNAAL